MAYKGTAPAMVDPVLLALTDDELVISYFFKDAFVPCIEIP